MSREINSAQGQCDLKKLQWMTTYSEPLLNDDKIVISHFLYHVLRHTGSEVVWEDVRRGKLRTV